MKIFNAFQVREWDAYTLIHEPVASIALMNRAAKAFTDWFLKMYPDPLRPVVIFAGTGNNGGDGLAVARMLDQAQYAAKVVICDFGSRHSADFMAQQQMISKFSGIHPLVIGRFEELHNAKSQLLPENAILIDALFGSGLNRVLENDWLEMVQFINQSGCEVVSIDFPSGLFCDQPTTDLAVVRAARTFTFQIPKMAFFFPENAAFLGEWTVGDIGLHPAYAVKTETPFYFFNLENAQNIRKNRSRFSHKGSFGHSLLIAGSWGKIGAAVLAARACLRAGTGLLSVHAPRCANLVLQSAVPEAMYSADKRTRFWSQAPELSVYSAIGVGPGIGQEPETREALKNLLMAVEKPVVLDADALNILAENPEWWQYLPENSILTPHPKEFERLFGTSENNFKRNEIQRKMAQKHRICLVLKGANTAISFPDGTCWFNSSGNPGMATGGSGDVLTGILTGLLAQNYSPKEACLLGVYVHGVSGDLAAETKSQEATTAGDLVDFLGAAWKTLTATQP